LQKLAVQMAQKTASLQKLAVQMAQKTASFCKSWQFKWPKKLLSLAKAGGLIGQKRKTL
jgi:hypothetical protein